MVAMAAAWQREESSFALPSLCHAFPFLKQVFSSYLAARQQTELSAMCSVLMLGTHVTGLDEGVVGGDVGRDGLSHISPRHQPLKDVQSCVDGITLRISVCKVEG